MYEIQADSLDMVELIHELEETFHVSYLRTDGSGIVHHSARVPAFLAETIRVLMAQSSR